MKIEMISEFQKEYRFLSNFWKSPMKIDGKDFISNEQWYVYNKTTDPDLRKEILLIEGAGDVKKFGRKIELREDWEDVRIEVMRKGLEAKFTQNPDLAEKLILTHPKLLQEGNRWGDTFWGVDLKTNEGENWLGKLLMDLRNRMLGECLRNGVCELEECATKIKEGSINLKL